MRYEVVIKQEEERRSDQPGPSLPPDGAVARKTQTLCAADAPRAGQTAPAVVRTTPDMVLRSVGAG